MAATLTDEKILNAVPGRDRGSDPAMVADESVRCVNDHGVVLVRILSSRRGNKGKSRAVWRKSTKSRHTNILAKCEPFASGLGCRELTLSVGAKRQHLSVRGQFDVRLRRRLPEQALDQTSYT